MGSSRRHLAHLARQPIVDRQRAVVAYELLHRVGAGDEWSPDDDLVTRQVVRKALIDFGLERLTGGKDVYLNVGAGCLAARDHLMFPAHRTVLEVLERTDVDTALIRDVLSAREHGFRIAIDDYVGDGQFDALLPHVDIVKLDVLGRSGDEIGDAIARVQHLAPQATLLAEKVESEEALRALDTQPISLFQGYYFKRPLTFRVEAAPSPTQGALLEVLGALSEDDIPINRLVTTIASVPLLAYELVRLVNVVAVGAARRVHSIRDAVILLGLGQVRRAVYILTLTACAEGNDHLVGLALVRAGMCARLAGLDGRDQSVGFTVGLFSVMESIVGRPLNALVAELPFTGDVADALVDNTGCFHEYLRTAIEFETPTGASDRGTTSALSPVWESYLQAVAWADAVQAGLRAAHR